MRFSEPVIIKPGFCFYWLMKWIISSRSWPCVGWQEQRDKEFCLFLSNFEPPVYSMTIEDKKLREYFKFDDADLDANRKGQFSEKQRMRLIEADRKIQQ